VNSWDWAVVAVVVYLLVGGLLLLWASSRDRGLYPDLLDWSGLAMVVGWPLLLLTWAIFRVPPPSSAPEPERKQTVGSPPAGVATSDLCPTGTVQVAGRQYAATTDDGPVRAGEPVQIIGRKRGTLRVRGCSAEPFAPDPPGK